MDLIGFIPCRAGSERVKNKNTRPFAGFDGGLLELKLRQLQRVPELSRIVVSTNDAAVLDYAERFRQDHDPRVQPLPRPDKYGVSSTSMGEFIRDYIAYLEQDGVMVWTHVTHPLITSASYREVIAAYHAAAAQGHDSLITATKLQKFLWKDGKPFNYDNSVEKWPRSQDIEPVYEINHGVYMMPFSVMRDTGDRIGRKPYFHAMPEHDAMDIDWQDQFDLLDEIARARVQRGQSLL
ncbi:cytidylyltransferase domain-containing protein [Roseomonas sp. 18066]|uniref:acylneuraminate cytidylyltransferase family protein n=1 Tax=Roseomonas sp. 18066 TaxID=2681412 RepID=UPI00135C4A5E|nr:acylneuraminate cytidylyltransferase family protein [Roseomonas sp. 18066]